MATSALTFDHLLGTFFLHLWLFFFYDNVKSCGDDSDDGGDSSRAGPSVDVDVDASPTAGASPTYSTTTAHATTPTRTSPANKDGFDHNHEAFDNDVGDFDDFDDFGDGGGDDGGAGSEAAPGAQLEDEALRQQFLMTTALAAYGMTLCRQIYAGAASRRGGEHLGKELLLGRTPRRLQARCTSCGEMTVLQFTGDVTAGVNLTPHCCCPVMGDVTTPEETVAAAATATAGAATATTATKGRPKKEIVLASTREDAIAQSYLTLPRGRPKTVAAEATKRFSGGGVISEADVAQYLGALLLKGEGDRTEVESSVVRSREKKAAFTRNIQSRFQPSRDGYEVRAHAVTDAGGTGLLISLCEEKPGTDQFAVWSTKDQLSNCGIKASKSQKERAKLLVERLAEVKEINGRVTSLELRDGGGAAQSRCRSWTGTASAGDELLALFGTAGVSAGADDMSTA